MHYTGRTSAITGIICYVLTPFYKICKRRLCATVQCTQCTLLLLKYCNRELLQFCNSVSSFLRPAKLSPTQILITHTRVPLNAVHGPDRYNQVLDYSTPAVRVNCSHNLARDYRDPIYLSPSPPQLTGRSTGWIIAGSKVPDGLFITYIIS
eukprot:sb/3473523/